MKSLRSFTMIVTSFLLVLIAVSLSFATSDTDRTVSFLDEPTVNSYQARSLEDIEGLTQDLVSDALSKAEEEILTEENRIQPSRDETKYGHTYQSKHYRSRYNPALEPARKRSLILERTAQKLADALGFETAAERKILIGLEDDTIKRSCLRAPYPKCSKSARYRTADGTCNNFLNPLLGSANTPFTRLFGADPDYGDGFSTPRLAKNKKELPNARRVSFTLFTDQDRPSKRLSHLAMVWGQFIDHDISLGAQPNINCEGKCGGLQGECFGIKIPADDPRFPLIDVDCIDVKRDTPALQPPCRLLAREQINTKTSFIDSSQTYGTSESTMRGGRDFSNNIGLMKLRDNPSGAYFKGLLPAASNTTFCRTPDQASMPCFRSGDMRTNENQGLASIHHLCVRAHNRIARQLKKINSHWRGDRIFNETRKIIGAMAQHVTYNEFLPEVLDPLTRSRFGLKLKEQGFFYGYNERIDPSIRNSFAAAAYRFGHSLIQNTFNRFGKKRKFSPIDTGENFNPTFLYDVMNGGIDAILRGLVTDPSQKVDGHFATAVQGNLKRFEGDISDLPAINIQRGRDHGLPGYNTFREICGRERAVSFKDFEAYISSKDVANLAQLYTHPDDVDLFAAAVLERPLPGGALGPTFACMVAAQFRKLRVGDRFWYERFDPVVGFSKAQLTELRKFTLARVICSNSDDIQMVPERVLSSDNTHVPCSSIPSVNLEEWRENRFYYDGVN